MRPAPLVRRPGVVVLGLGRDGEMLSWQQTPDPRWVRPTLIPASNAGVVDNMAGVPSAVVGGRPYKQVSTGYNHTCAVTIDGRMPQQCGAARRRHLSELASPTPAQIIGPFGLPVSAATLSAGTEHGCGVSAAGQGMGWEWAPAAGSARASRCRARVRCWRSGRCRARGQTARDV